MVALARRGHSVTSARQASLRHRRGQSSRSQSPFARPGQRRRPSILHRRDHRARDSRSLARECITRSFDIEFESLNFMPSQHLLYWAPVPVISALRFLFPKFKGDPILLQYALRVLEHHPVEVTFFYIPQVVQALRTDDLGWFSSEQTRHSLTLTIDPQATPRGSSLRPLRSRNSSAIRSSGT